MWLIWVFACAKSPAPTASVVAEVEDPCVRTCLGERSHVEAELALIECQNQCAIQASISEKAERP